MLKKNKKTKKTRIPSVELNFVVLTVYYHTQPGIIARRRRVVVVFDPSNATSSLNVRKRLKRTSSSRVLYRTTFRRAIFACDARRVDSRAFISASVRSRRTRRAIVPFVPCDVCVTIPTWACAVRARRRTRVHGPIIIDRPSYRMYENAL